MSPTVMVHQYLEPPVLCYLLCATPRTGSTLLCETLRATGKFGRPDEYFEFLKDTGLPRQPAQYFIDFASDGRVMKLLGCPQLKFNYDVILEHERHGYRRYLNRVLSEGRTANGVFGAKIMWGHVPDFLDLLTGNPDVLCSRRVHRSLRTSFPSLKYIRVTRRDKLRQAISLWKAIQTQRWRLSAGDRVAERWREPVFDIEAIEYLQMKVATEDRAWELFFKTIRTQPLVLYYEDFCIDMASIVPSVAAYLGLPCSSATASQLPSMVRQSDRQSEEWVTECRSRWHATFERGGIAANRS